MRTVLFSLTLLTTPFLQADIPQKDHEIWWEKNLGKEVSFSTFANWLGSVDAETRVAFRNEVSEKGYTSILDVPAGLAIDYTGLKRDNSEVQYTGVDITPVLVSIAQQHGINCVLGDIENLPFSDNSFEISHARHILEHLNSYEAAIRELIRVSAKEVFITFFIKPVEAENHTINLNTINGYLLYHNGYAKNLIEEYVTENPKVESFEWVDVTEKETVLKIFLNT